MAIRISGKDGLVSGFKELDIQNVPFKIYADCDAKVSKYFNVYVKTKGDGALSASFRGYPLDGKTVSFPVGYKGVVLHESVRPDTDKEDRKFYIVGTFNSVRYWNWDKMPSKNDSFIQATDWIDIAEVLHSPVKEE